MLLLASIGAPLALALLLASAFSADVAALIAQVYVGIVQLLVWLITPLVIVVFGVVEALGRLLRGLATSSPPVPPPTPVGPPALPGTAQGTPAGLPAWLGPLASLLVELLPVLLTLVLVLRRPRRTRLDDAGAEERESVWSWEAAGRDLQSWWQQIWGRRARPERDALTAALARLRGDDPVTVIRRTYVQLLIRGEQTDRGRAPEQTPAEYAQALAPLFPGDQEALLILTRTYEQARYHPTTTTPAHAAVAVNAWEQIASAAPLSRKSGDGVTR